MAKHFLLLPAIDVQGGVSVRVSAQGVEQTAGSPIEQAELFQQEGATWIHLVDLDAAYGTGENRALLGSIIKSLAIPVQLSGGIHDQQSVAQALDLAPARINLGSRSLNNLDWVREVIAAHGDLVSVALDVQGDVIAPRGSTERGPLLDDVLAALSEAGCRRVVVTDKERDGSLQGPNLELLSRVKSSFSGNVIASGGIASLADIDALRALEIEGAIIGKAIYAGEFTVKAALERAGG